jgi:pyruvate,orthophosphate dikinase
MRSPASRANHGVRLDTELSVDALRELTRRFARLYEFPSDPREQLRRAILAVFDSWTGERGCRLPAHQGHPGRLGDRGQRPADGVRQHGRGPPARASPSRATRSRAHPSRAATSSRTPRARTSCPACARRATCPSSATGCLPSTCSCARSCAAGAPLQGHAGHRVHRRGGTSVHAADAQRPSAPPKRRCASPSTPVEGGPDDAAEAIATIDAGALDALLHPHVRTRRPLRRHRRAAVAASPGAAKGEIVFTAAGRRGSRCGPARAVILVRQFTEADDVAGFHRGEGDPHRRGRQGLASGARWARGHGRPGRHRGRRRSTSTCTPARCTSAIAFLHEGDSDRHRRHDRARSRSTTCRW